jgi:hypothetical protein
MSGKNILKIFLKVVIQGCQILLGTIDQNVEKYTKLPQNTYTKCP